LQALITAQAQDLGQFRVQSMNGRVSAKNSEAVSCSFIDNDGRILRFLQKFGSRWLIIRYKNSNNSRSVTEDLNR